MFVAVCFAVASSWFIIVVVTADSAAASASAFIFVRSFAARV